METYSIEFGDQMFEVDAGDYQQAAQLAVIRLWPGMHYQAVRVTGDKLCSGCWAAYETLPDGSQSRVHDGNIHVS